MAWQLYKVSENPHTKRMFCAMEKEYLTNIVGYIRGRLLKKKLEKMPKDYQCEFYLTWSFAPQSLGLLFLWCLAASVPISGAIYHLIAWLC